VSSTDFPKILSPFSAEVLALRAQLSAFERLDPAAQAAARDAQLKDLVRHARCHSGYWQKRLSAYGSRARFDSLPVLSRADLQQHAHAMVCPPGTVLPHTDKTFVARTSGSTGVPVEVTKGSPAYEIVYQAHSLRSFDWHELDTGRDVVAVRDAPDGTYSRAWGEVLAEVGWTGKASVRNMVEHSPEDLWEWLRETTAPYLVTTAAVVARLAHIALADPRGQRRRLEAILTFGEAVTPEHRRAASEAFGARIVDRYSSEEVGWIAFQCPRHDHHHALTASTHVEIVDDDNRAVVPGQEGRVLVTSMHSHAMPIVRYDIGDRAIAGARCDCGISLPVITQILGRQRSLIELPDGTSRLARLTGEHWRAIAPVSEYRVVQYRDGELEAFVVAACPLTPAHTLAMQSMLKQQLHTDLRVTVTQVERIEWESRWKRIDVARVDRLRSDAA